MSHNIRRTLVGIFNALTVPFGVLGALYAKDGAYWQAAVFIAVAMVLQYVYTVEKPYWSNGGK